MDSEIPPPPFPNPDRAGITPAPKVQGVGAKSLEQIISELTRPDGGIPDDNSGQPTQQDVGQPGQFTLSRRQMIGLVVTATGALGAGTGIKYGPGIVNSLADEI